MMPSAIGLTIFMVTVMIKIQVVFATNVRQMIVDLEVNEGTTIGAAVEQSNIKVHFQSEDFSQVKYGIWGKAKSLNEVVSQDDRVEIYRPLVVDPKEARRRRARQ